MMAKYGQMIKEYFMITLAVIVMDIGVYVFKFPNNFSFGGVSGLAVVATHFLPFTASQINLLVNMFLLILGFLFLGKGFGVKTAYVTIVSSLLLNVMEVFLPMNAPLTNETMLELLYAIALPAISSALLFYESASGGGTDIIAMILKKYSTMDISSALMLVDAGIVVVACFTFDTKTGLYSICGLMAKTLVIDKAIERMKLNKYFTIICSDPDPICDYIMKELNRSATVYKAEGAYSHQGKVVILTVMGPKQAVLLERYIQSVEPDAFLMVTKSSEIMGNGFKRDI
ncbi:MAG: YitT family protein [Lachnospiraceae bacterium]|nr:YitT family protein [Lachnospiraceae bacterium]